MRNAALTLVTCALTLLVARDAGAQGFGSGFAVAARVGTLGPGLEVSTPLTSRLNLRVGGHYLPYSRQDVVEDLAVKVQVDSDVQFSSFNALLDYFALGPVRLTGGLVLNRNEGDFLVTPLESYSLNEKEFSPEKIGTMTARLSYESKVAPYLGLGLGNPVGVGKKLGFLFDLGAVFTSPPTLEMEGTSMIAPTATQAPEIQEGLDAIKVFPVLALGLSFQL